MNPSRRKKLYYAAMAWCFLIFHAPQVWLAWFLLFPETHDGRQGRYYLKLLPEFIAGKAGKGLSIRRRGLDQPFYGNCLIQRSCCGKGMVIPSVSKIL